ncbi:MAG TPA: helix-turn-helix transcriptional regulator [Methylomirabilota bacterium]|nr:helix-turn-helix transcriptional regulator [Methylomirabilota bacterium]
MSDRGPDVHAGSRSSTEPVNGRVLLAVNLRRLRGDRALSQEALADRAGIHRTYLGSVERAQRNIAIDNICRLAWALGVDVRELLSPARMPAREYGTSGRRPGVLKVSESAKHAWSGRKAAPRRRSR